MNDQPAAVSAATAPRRLTRNSDNAMLGGVCSGLADHFGLDVTLVRVLTVLGVVFGFGSVAVAYIVAWVLLPKY
jgi:phage shock protein PspC (stress-responsive transcriptional regulator)